MDHVFQHRLQHQQSGFSYDLVVCAEEQDCAPVHQVPGVPFFGQQGQHDLSALQGELPFPFVLNLDRGEVRAEDILENTVKLCCHPVDVWSFVGGWASATWQE